MAAGDHRAWRHLPRRHGSGVASPDLRPRLDDPDDLFGTTYYSLVGLHAIHVTIGLLAMSLTACFALLRYVTPAHAWRIEVLAIYWHFVDVVWVVVFSVVYLIGR